MWSASGGTKNCHFLCFGVVLDHGDVIEASCGLDCRELNDPWSGWLATLLEFSDVLEHNEEDVV